MYQSPPRTGGTQPPTIFQYGPTFVSVPASLKVSRLKVWHLSSLSACSSCYPSFIFIPPIIFSEGYELWSSSPYSGLLFPSTSWIQTVSSVFSKNLGSTATRHALSQSYTKGKIITYQPWCFHTGNGTKEDSEPNGNKTVMGVHSDVVKGLYRGVLCCQNVMHDYKGKCTLTLRLLMSYIYIYIYGAPILDVSRSHTTTQHSR